MGERVLQWFGQAAYPHKEREREKKNYNNNNNNNKIGVQDRVVSKWYQSQGVSLEATGASLEGTPYLSGPVVADIASVGTLACESSHRSRTLRPLVSISVGRGASPEETPYDGGLN